MRFFWVKWLTPAGYVMQLWHDGDLDLRAFTWASGTAVMAASRPADRALLSVDEVLECPLGKDCGVCHPRPVIFNLDPIADGTSFLRGREAK